MKGIFWYTRVALIGMGIAGALLLSACGGGGGGTSGSADVTDGGGPQTVAARAWKAATSPAQMPRS